MMYKQGVCPQCGMYMTPWPDRSGWTCKRCGHEEAERKPVDFAEEVFFLLDGNLWPYMGAMLGRKGQFPLIVVWNDATETTDVIACVEDASQYEIAKLYASAYAITLESDDEDSTGTNAYIVTPQSLPEFQLQVRTNRKAGRPALTVKHPFAQSESELITGLREIIVLAERAQGGDPEALESLLTTARALLARRS